ncbi:MAG TPA: dipeptide ABC transporter permease DppC, partial [Hyphomicrobiales bacterium]|nr:dipeptide ABC transporter permease DppC [Hyphomicrobiales bacterium]
MSDAILDPATPDERPTGARATLAEFWYYFRENRGAVIGLYFFIFICLVAIFADIIAPYGPSIQYRDALLTPPVWQDGGDWRFLLGTDAVGRDMLSRLIHGARYSLFVGIIVVSGAMVVGVAVGLIAGFFGGL